MQRELPTPFALLCLVVCFIAIVATSYIAVA